jgi:hypothetical protein
MLRKTPFQLPHALEFGLLITGRDTKSFITSVICHFYACFKRAEQPGAKRQRTENTKYYSTPFRKENYKNTIAINILLNGRNTKKLAREKKWSFLKQ